LEFVVDLGEELTLAGFTYLPRQSRHIHGTITHYRFYASRDGRSWGDPVSSGEFGNIRNSPILQVKEFDPVPARYIRLVADEVVETLHSRRGSTADYVSIAELGVISH
jgi:alpha-L-fucosidase